MSPDAPPAAPDAAALERALRAERLDVRVDAEGRLALLRPDGPAASPAALRARAWPLARAAGFTHVAVEIPDDGGAPPAADAPVPRD